MDITDYADAININLVLTYYPNQNKRWAASFEYVEVLNGGILASVYGSGSTPDEALADYAETIRNEVIVQHAHSGVGRRELTVPESITRK